MREIFSGVFISGKRLFTKSIVNERDSITYAKSLKRKGNKIFREWDPSRSKPAAAILKGLKLFPLKRGMKVLYLGVANGTTASFFSDIVGKEGLIYGVEISERTMHELVPLSEARKNIVPILANARLTDTYSWVENVDLVYEDVASNDQDEILVKNCNVFLKEGGYAMMAIKSRSIDVTKDPKKVFKHVLKKLEKHFKVLDRVRLEPYEKDHMFVVMKKI